jgi:hypothetical protein
MTTKLDKALKREIEVNSVTYTVTFSPGGVKIVEKGKRNGPEHSWEQLIGGGASLSRDLQASVDATRSGDGGSEG